MGKHRHQTRLDVKPVFVAGCAMSYRLVFCVLSGGLAYLGSFAGVHEPIIHASLGLLLS